MKYILRLSRELQGQYRWIIAAGFLSVATIGSNLGLMMSSAFIIASAALHPSIADLQVAIVGVRFFGISRGIFRYLERLLSHEITFRLIKSLRIRFFQTLDRIIISILGTRHSAELLSNVTEDIQQLENFFIKVVYPPFSSLIVTVFVIAVFYFIHPLAALIIFIGMTASEIVVGASGFILSLKAHERSQQLSTQSFNRIQEFLQGQDELYLWDRTDAWKNEIANELSLYQKLKRKLYSIESLTENISALGLYFTLFALFWFLIPEVSGNSLTGISLTILVIGSMAAFEAVDLIPQASINMAKILYPAKRIFQLEDMKSSLIKTREETTIPVKPDIVLKDVRFSFADRIILEDIKLTIPFGKKTAIIGPTGHGKSTLKNLIMGIYDNYTGEINVGNILARDILGYSPLLFRTIEQNNYIFDRTFKNNIILNDKSISDDRVNNLIEDVNLQNLIQNQENGILSYPGQNGEKISGGERQRLAVARALARETPIMICDEATANLDSKNEENIFRKIQSATKDKTLIWITHKMRFLDEFDQIIVVLDGRINQSGTFKQLISEQGYFRDMWNLESGFIG